MKTKMKLMLMCLFAVVLSGCVQQARNPGQKTEVGETEVNTEGPGRNPFVVDADRVSGDAGYPATNATMVYPSSDETGPEGNVTKAGTPFKITGHTPGSATILANDLTQTAALIPGVASAEGVEVYNDEGRLVTKLTNARIDNSSTLTALASWQQAINPVLEKFSDDQRSAYELAVKEANASLQKAIDLVAPISQAAAEGLKRFMVPLP